jgi:hypothetical protein
MAVDVLEHLYALTPMLSHHMGMLLQYRALLGPLPLGPETDLALAADHVFVSTDLLWNPEGIVVLFHTKCVRATHHRAMRARLTIGVRGGRGDCSGNLR